MLYPQTTNSYGLVAAETPRFIATNVPRNIKARTTHMTDVKGKNLRTVMELAMSGFYDKATRKEYSGFKVSVGQTKSGEMTIKLSKGLWLGRQKGPSIGPDGEIQRVDYAD